MKTIEIQGRVVSFDGDELVWHDGENSYHVRSQEDVNALGLQENGYLLPSNHKVGDEVIFSIVQEYGENPYPFRAKVLGVHFYTSKVKYDLEIPIYGESSTRIYNIDSCFVLKS